MFRYSLLLLVLLSHSLIAQTLLQRTLNNDTMPNLVPNPGFEQTKRLQCAWTQKARKFNDEVMIGWNSPTETTPDHFSTLNDPNCWANPTKRTNGKTTPRAGDCMTGIKVWGKGATPTYWHEYLQIELPETLEAGKRYIMEMFVQRGNFSDEASNNLGMYLSAVPVKTRDCLPLYFTPQVNEDETVDNSGWHKVRGVIDAIGTERYLLIGNFYSDEITHHKRLPQGERGAYYFIDDVNIRTAPPGTTLTAKPMISTPPPPKKKVADHTTTATVDLMQVEPEVGKHIVLNNIFFDLDKATLKKESEVELEKLIDLLTDYPMMRIAIEGHTDDQGSDTHNQQLSDARANAVVDYLIAKKVDKDRLSAKGFGESQPLLPNTSEENRAQNRRVEFRVVER